MLREVIRAIWGIGGSTGFETYLTNLQQQYGASGPREAEARKDYQAILRSRSPFKSLNNWP